MKISTIVEVRVMSGDPMKGVPGKGNWKSQWMPLVLAEDRKVFGFENFSVSRMRFIDDLQEMLDACEDSARLLMDANSVIERSVSDETEECD